MGWIYGVFGLKLVIWKVLLLGCFLEKLIFDVEVNVQSFDVNSKGGWNRE